VSVSVGFCRVKMHETHRSSIHRHPPASPMSARSKNRPIFAMSGLRLDREKGVRGALVRCDFWTGQKTKDSNDCPVTRTGYAGHQNRSFSLELN